MYGVRLKNGTRYSKTLDEARRLLVEEFRTEGRISCEAVMNGSIIGYVTPKANTLWWVFCEDGINFYTPLKDDGTIQEGEIPTDVVPGEKPLFYVKHQKDTLTSTANLKTAREFISAMTTKDLDWYDIYNDHDALIEEHLIDGRGHHYITKEGFDPSHPDSRVYYKATKNGTPTNKTYDDWKISDRLRPERM